MTAPAAGTTGTLDDAGHEPTGPGRGQRFQVVVIGAGFAGIGMAIRLQDAGVNDYVVLEKAADVGGTWRDNTYPGAACDVPSYLYSFSFEQLGGWSRPFAGQTEIKTYLDGCVRRHRLEAKIRFGAEVTSAEWDDSRSVWTVRTADGLRIEAEFLVFGVGQLNRPARPAVPGMDRYAGTAVHSAQWEQAGDLRGRRVGIIGNGATAIQIVASISGQVEQLTVFQRSANWIMPKIDVPFTARQRWWLNNVPWARRVYRAKLYWERENRFRTITGGTAAAKRTTIALEHIARQVPDPQLRATLTPNYPIGCKRILQSSEYYPAVSASNVDVVTSRIDECTGTGIRTADGTQHELDTLIFATGFRATEFLAPVEVIGRGGKRLHDVWRDGASAYLGMMVPDFPNMFALYGPNTNLGHNSIVFMLECQYRFVLAARTLLREREATAVEVTQAAMRAYDERLTARLASTSWAGPCTNWYKTDTGRIVNNWPNFTFAYWLRTKWLRRRHLRLSTSARADAKGAAPGPSAAAGSAHS